MKTSTPGGALIAGWRIHIFTAVIITQYLVLVVLPELTISPSGRAGTIWMLTLTGAAALVAGSLAGARGPIPGPKEASWPSWGFILTILLIGSAARMVATIAGSGTFANQVAGQNASPIAAAFTPFSSFNLFACALAIPKASLRSRKGALLLCLVALLVEIAAARLTLRVAPLFNFLVTLIALLVMYNLVRVRTILGIGAVVLVAWPTIHAVRNEERLDQGAEYLLYVEENPTDRLAVNRFLALTSDADGSPHAPRFDILLQARTGLVPRFLDPTRPALSAGSDLSVALGGSRANSMTLSLFGNIFVASGGLLALAATTFVLGYLGSWLARIRTPLAAMVFAAALKAFAWIETSWPDAIAEFIQGSTTALLVIVLWRLWPRPGEARRSGGTHAHFVSGGMER